VVGSVSNLPIGNHGLHLYEDGDISEKCTKVGKHLNYIGNIDVKSPGKTQVIISNRNITLSGSKSIIGRSVTITENVDRSGRLIGCGVIGKVALNIETPLVSLKGIFNKK